MVLLTDDITINNFDQVIKQSFDGLFEIVEICINGDDLDRDIINALNG